MNDRTRVLVATDAMSVWGAEQQVLEASERLAVRGFEIILAAPSGSPLHEVWGDAGMAHVAFDSAPRRGLRRGDTGRRPGPGVLASQIRDTVANARTLAGLARDADVDVVHSHSLVTNLEVAVAGRLVHRRSVLDVHDIVRAGLGRKVLTTGAALAQAVIANSRATASTVGWPATAKVSVIWPGVETERFRPGPPDEAVRARLAGDRDDPLVGIVGRVDPEKGVDILVRAVTALNQRGRKVNLVVVGAPTARHRCYAEALQADAARQLGDRVRFVGAVPDPDQVIRALDVLVNASHAEPFGRSVLEAQASGVPVVATRAGGIVDFVAHERTGLLVAPDDEAALAGALDRLLGDRLLGQRMARAALDQARSRYSADAHADAVGRVWRGDTPPHPST